MTEYLLLEVIVGLQDVVSKLSRYVFVLSDEVYRYDHVKYTILVKINDLDLKFTIIRENYTISC